MERSKCNRRICLNTGYNNFYSIFSIRLFYHQSVEGKLISSMDRVELEIETICKNQKKNFFNIKFWLNLTPVTIGNKEDKKLKLSIKFNFRTLEFLSHDKSPLVINYVFHCSVIFQPHFIEASSKNLAWNPDLAPSNRWYHTLKLVNFFSSGYVDCIYKFNLLMTMADDIYFKTK